MTLYQFNSLSPKEKEIAMINGEFLADRREESDTIALYAVCNFYVEAYYDNALNAVTMLAAFRSTDRLGPYLQHIRVPTF
ncbi:hypothetical protein EOD41_08965 [Mucilaginibacter limnophilus]|uniref:Uncharacterized protein n=1 Tax=Mucilaginibacter limnophilus TaxID=1932778 RepID=A0A437MWR1_9SPHI|nr:hypothetical protein [Mucilaginibacter limnophilus]RVU02069.1 hypothetical protein EOD41_08965 [Mucilaginibacter limnophilus]